GAAALPALWPVAARAQQPMPVVGFVRSDPLSPDSPLVAAFREGLKEAGFIDSRNVAIELRSADNHLDRLPALMADLVRRPVAVIIANGAASDAAATSTIPIIFTLRGD